MPKWTPSRKRRTDEDDIGWRAACWATLLLQNLDVAQTRIAEYIDSTEKEGGKFVWNKYDNLASVMTDFKNNLNSTERGTDGSSL